MFSRRVKPSEKTQTPSVSHTTPRVYRAGDPINEYGSDRGWLARPMTQEEADHLNNIHPDQDEHALEALAGVDVPLRGWRLLLVWAVLLVGSWVLFLALGLGLWELLQWLIGEGL
jgi:hypothetical protein